MLKPSRTTLLRHVLGAATIGLALFLTAESSSVSRNSPFLFVATAVVLIAFYAGLGPCVVASVVGAIGMYFIAHPPAYSLLAYIGVATLVGYVSNNRKRAYQRLRRQALIFAHMTDAVTMVDLNRRIIDVNPAAEKMFGYSKDEMLGKSITMIQRPEDSPSLGDAIVRAIARDGVWKGEKVFVKKDGSQGVCETTVLAVRDEEGKNVARLGIHCDVTDRRELREQLLHSQKMEAVGRMAGAIAHDFNNLLTAILGYSQLLISRARESDPMRPGLQEIAKAGQRAAALTGQLLAFSRKQVLQPRVLSLNSIVRDLEGMLGRLMGEDVQLEVRLGRELGKIKADPTQLEQVVMNLAVNARDAMPEGGRLTIETSNLGAESNGSGKPNGHKPPRVSLTMTDTGVGMDPDTQSRIFEPFFTTKGPGKGTGLGLSTVYGIVKQSGGDIFVYSQPGGGARFEIVLPGIESADEILQLPPSAKPRHEGVETILVTEDEAAVLSLVADILTPLGYTILVAGNGRDARKICETYTAGIDLLLTDVVMPQIGGRELADQLTRMRPGMRVLFMSGYTDDAILLKGGVGPDAPFIAKPFTSTGLAEKIREVLDR
ncbi:MAG TPA: ATP-binding protein [Blastocatellia bacterium]|nr:ATP-binding protein [Blastocatellia bacterium]